MKHQSEAEQIAALAREHFNNVQVIRGGKNSPYAWARRGGYYILYDGKNFFGEWTGRQSKYFSTADEAITFLRG